MACRGRGAPPPSIVFANRRKTAQRAVSQGAQAGPSEAYSQYAAACARRRATPDHAISLASAAEALERSYAQTHSRGQTTPPPLSPPARGGAVIPHAYVASKDLRQAVAWPAVGEAPRLDRFREPPKNGAAGRQPRRASRAERGVLPVRRSVRPAPRNAGSRPAAPFFT